jgi:Fe-S cluster biogenesis protein NfuA
VATLPDMSEKGPLDLTWENVELVLDDMRPYLIQDGGNVAITEIDGPVVRLELQGACGTCPSSTVSIVSRLFSALVVCSQSHL